MGEKEVPFLYCNKNLKPEFSNLQKIYITSSDFTIGRGLKNSVIIPFLSISRQHCIIRKSNFNAWFIENYSSYGIEINGIQLGKGNEKRLKHQDVISLEPSHEFIYLFMDPFHKSDNNEDSLKHPKKRVKLENSIDNNDIINNVKTKFELSQCFEMQFIEDKIQKTKQMQEKSIILKNNLQTEMDKKINTLQNYYTVQIKNLEGEKSAVEKQKALLITKRDTKLAMVKKEMEEKLLHLKAQIDQHNITESELITENNLLKQKLLKEREEFLTELNKESSSKHDLLKTLEAKIHEQELIHLKEKKELQETLQKETERLNTAKEKELKLLEAQKKSRESELLHELDTLKNSYKSKMEEVEQHEHQVTYVLSNNTIDKIENLSPENKIRVEKLVKEREDLQKKLIEAKLVADKSITELEIRVQDRETELATLASERIQKYSEQSTEVISSLLEQLDKIKNQLKSVESEKEMLKVMNETRGCSKKENAVAEFTDIMESELQCSICSELFVNATTLNCSHTFCKSCITKWQKNKQDCPICRASISLQCKSLVLDSFIEKVVENMSSEMKQRRLDLLKLREEEEREMMTKAKQIAKSSRRRMTRRTTRSSTPHSSRVRSSAEPTVNSISTVDLIESFARTIRRPRHPAIIDMTSTS